MPRVLPLPLQVPDDIWTQFWRALQLPARVEEAVFQFTASMAEHEDMFLAKLKKDTEDFAAEIADMARNIQVRGHDTTVVIPVHHRELSDCL